MPDSYPPTLNTLFNDNASSSLLKDNDHRCGYEPVFHLTSEEVLSILALPLAKAVSGRDVNADDDDSLFTRLSSGEISYTRFVAERVKRVVSGEDEPQQQQQSSNQTSDWRQRRSQLLYIGLAALFSFLQSNVTGPPLNFSPVDVLLPSCFSSSSMRKTENVSSSSSSLKALREKIIRELSVDGEAAYRLTPNVELFAIAKAVLVNAGNVFFDLDQAENCAGQLVARIARMRVNFLHQKMLSEVTGTLQDAIYGDLEELGKWLFSSDSTSSTVAEAVVDKGSFLLERALINTHHGFDAKARADIEQAAAVRGFEFALTGKLGKRTKFQDRDISQLVVLAKSAETKEGQPETKGQQQPSAGGPKNLDLNDDTLLESISFSKGNNDEQQQQVHEGKSGTVQDETSLPPALASLEPGNQPILNPVDSAILLALTTAITNTSPDHGLTREETFPYADRVLEGGSSNWQIYTQALLVRSRLEGYKTRTVERSVLQMQALVDQVVADTATFDMATGKPANEVPATFLPGPEKTESAPAAERLDYIWLMNFSTRWDLEAELASRWVKLGGLRTALEIYERLELWAEVALCYAATEREEKARCVVRGQLFQPTNKDDAREEKEEDVENEKFEGPERSPLPADAPRLFCILGDIDSDPAMYERAWEVSNKRYARAQRSLARYYLTSKPPALEKAEEAYRKSLYINRLNHGAWFALGCVQLELEKWEDAIESFARTVQIDESDAEAWSNLAAAILRVPPSKPTTDLSSASTTTEETRKAEDPYKQKREALSALHRAAQLKHSDHRIWDNVLTVAASIPPPLTPFKDIVLAQRRVIELLGPKVGEKAVDTPILGLLVDYLVNNYEYEELLIPSDPSGDPNITGWVLRSGTIPGQILSLIEDCIMPLITHSASLWLLVARVERFREQPTKAFEAHEKAWRATVVSATQGAFQMGNEDNWNDVVLATERLVRDGYARFGPMEKEKHLRDTCVGGEGEREKTEEESEIVAKDWRFKARSAIRGVMGKGRDFWEDTEGWKRLKGLQVEVSGG